MLYKINSKGLYIKLPKTELTFIKKKSLNGNITQTKKMKVLWKKCCIRNSLIQRKLTSLAVEECKSTWQTRFRLWMSQSHFSWLSYKVAFFPHSLYYHLPHVLMAPSAFWQDIYFYKYLDIQRMVYFILIVIRI